ncbi:MAG: hypothetical protein SFU86_03285 [Pirellulaceae bacterium]|nr:hypothetical protein [Pirellulaceae bacterium]
MAHDRLFVLQVVIAIEEQWFAPGTIGPPVRCERRYRVDEMLFAAADEEAAYRTATNWLSAEAFSDQNHDGPGDLTRIFAIGMHQLDEIAPLSQVAEQASDLYGIDLPGFCLGDVDENGVPIVRVREELEVFRRQRNRAPRASGT